jgi:hypothetical protein
MRASPALLIAAIAWSAAAAQPAFALQSDYSTKETRALMHAYAKCVVDRKPAKASEAILANVDSGTIVRRYGMLINGECLAREARDSVKMSFSGDLYHYALAEALVNRELGDLTLPDLSGLPRLSHREPGEEPREVTAAGKKLSKRKFEEARNGYAKSVAYSFLSKYGECVVRLNPAGAKALLLTAADSQDETARFAALRPALASCMPEGNTIRFGRTALRGSIAINYYRLAHAARAVATKASS